MTNNYNLMQNAMKCHKKEQNGIKRVRGETSIPDKREGDALLGKKNSIEQPLKDESSSQDEQAI